MEASSRVGSWSIYLFVVVILFKKRVFRGIKIKDVCKLEKNSCQHRCQHQIFFGSMEFYFSAPSLGFKGILGGIPLLGGSSHLVSG